MYCPKCGTQNPDDAKFCGSCGAAMNIPITNPVNNFPYTPPPTAVVTNGMKIGIAIASLVIPLIGIIMGWIYMVDPNPAKKSVGKLWLIVGIIMAILYCILYSIGNESSY